MNSLFELTQYFLTEPLWLWWGLLLVFCLSFFLGFRYWVFLKLKKQSSAWELNLGNDSKKVAHKEDKKSYRFLLFSLAVLSFVLGWFTKGAWGALLGFLITVALGYVIAWQSRQGIKQELQSQIPLFLRALGSTLRAGYSVPQALEFVALEVESPLRERLAPGLTLLQLQQPLDDTLEVWQKDLEQTEFAFWAQSLVSQSKTGGDLVDLCHKVAFLLEERLKLERDLKSFTAQGKMSGLLMAALWPISLLLFAWLAPSHTDILFQTVAGQILLGLSLLLELIGFYFIWRLLHLKV